MSVNTHVLERQVEDLITRVDLLEKLVNQLLFMVTKK